MRKLMWFALGFGCACVLCGYLFARWLLFLGAAAAIMSAVLLLFCREKRVLRIIGVVLMGLYIGIGWWSVYDQWILASPGKLDGSVVNASMTVLDEGFETDYGTAADVELIIDNFMEINKQLCLKMYHYGQADPT